MGKVVGEGVLLLMFLTHTTSYIVHPLQTNGLNEVEPQSSQVHDNRDRGTLTNRGSYAFGYEIEDSQTNNVQFKNEERHENGTVTGNYGYLQPDGNVQKVSYVADKYGYRASVEIVPRGVLKPIQLFRPETHLLDFSSNLPAYKNVEPQVPLYKTQDVVQPPYAFKQAEFSTPLPQKPIQPTMTKEADSIAGYSSIPHPQGVSNYITKRLEKPKYRMERGFVPYFPQNYKASNPMFQNLVRDHYVFPLQ